MKRRTFLKAAGAGVTAVGIEGILAAHRAPAFAQGTTLHILRWNDFVPAADEMLRKEYVPEVEKALGHQAQRRDDQRQRPPGRASPRRSSRAPVPTSSCCSTTTRTSTRRAGVDVSDVAEEVGKAQGGIYTLAAGAVQGRLALGGDALVHRRRHDRLPQVLVRGGRRERASRRPGSSTARSARSSRPRAARSARRSATPSATRRRSPIPSCGRSAGRRSTRPTARWSINSKETIESVKFMTALLEGRARRGRPRLGRHQQQPRVPRRGRSRATLNGASIYIESLRKPGQVQDREGRAAEHRHPARAAAEGAGRAVRATTPRSRTW